MLRFPYLLPETLWGVQRNANCQADSLKQTCIHGPEATTQHITPPHPYTYTHTHSVFEEKCFNALFLIHAKAKAVLGFNNERVTKAASSVTTRTPSIRDYGLRLQ